jgi:PAS domain S-box-containing protein
LVRLPGLRKATTSRRPLRVLIVEDSENDALLLLRELRRGGYEPEHEQVQTPEAMKEALAGSEWDVIISDYHLPRFGAPEALAISREAGLEVPFVVVSGKVGEESAVEALKAGAHDYVMKGNLTRLCATVERGLEEAQQRRRHNAILEAVRFAAEHFLGNPTGWEENVRSVLHRLGEAAGVSRVYIFENYVGEDGQVWATQRYEWVAPGVPAQIDNPVLRAIPYRDAGFARWEEVLGRGSPVYGNTADFPESERPEMRAEEILSIVVVPIFVEGRWWGFIGFDDCSKEREWSVAEIDALKAATSTLGAALQRQVMEEDLRGSEERYRAVIEQATDGIYLLDADARRILETNPSFEKMLGYAADEMRGMEVYDIVAHPRENVDATIERTLRERRRVVGGRRYRRKDGSVLDVEVGVSVISHDDREVICTIVRDVTERKKSEEALRQSERLYRTVIEEVTENICLVDVETRRIVGSNPAFRETLGYTEEELGRMTLYDIVAHDRGSVDQNVWRTVEVGRSLVGQRKYRRKDGTLLDVEASGSIILRDDRETLCVVAHDVTERARAQELLEERVATLSHIASDLAFDLPTEDTLNVLARSAVNASTAVACAVILIDERDETPHLFGSHGLPEGYTAGLQAAYRAGARSPSLEAFRKREPVLVHDLRRFLLADPGYAPIHRFVREVPWDIVYSLPLVSRDRAVGSIFFCYLPGLEPGEDERIFLEAVADQAAVAVENARLFAQTRGKAALEERQRLARELHDSVSQALYGIALGAKTARKLLDQNPERVADPLDYVLSLAEAGLAEMRALIFELRPESLETEGLVAALEKQAAALRARHEIEVQAVLCDEPEASPEAKEAVYRIAQEALHNTVKHARASQVEIRMNCGSGWISLEVSDDGVGFDAKGEFPGHLGLRSMDERAQRLGGRLEVVAAPGSGARIRARIPV